MDRVLSDRIVKAMKNYPCDACAAWDRANMSAHDCVTVEHQMFLSAAEADKWRILCGQSYRKVMGIHEGEFCTFRARVGMDALCRHFGLYEE
jgi:hypothetical protein